MAGNRVDLSPILGNGVAAAALFAAALRTKCLALGKAGVAEGIDSVSYADGTVKVRFASRVAAAECRLLKPELETALSETAANLGWKRPIILNVR